MRQNHISRVERLRARINKLEHREDTHRKKSGGGNPYMRCTDCGITDPALFVPNGRHFTGCSMQGIDKQIKYFKKLLEQAKAEALQPKPIKAPKLTRYERLGIPLVAGGDTL